MAKMGRPAKYGDNFNARVSARTSSQVRDTIGKRLSQLTSVEAMDGSKVPTTTDLVEAAIMFALLNDDEAVYQFIQVYSEKVREFHARVVHNGEPVHDFLSEARESISRIA